MALEKRTAIITGGGQGIGKAAAIRLLKQGINVVIAEVDAEAGEETEEALKTYGDIKYIPCDIAKEDEVILMVEQSMKYFGRIDILINNAAISINKSITELTLDEWNRIIATNLTGAFLCSKYCTPYIKKQRGSIINIASTRAFMSEPNTEGYSASKGGVFALTHAMAASLGPDIRVNSISPGWIETGEWKKSSARKPAVHTEMDLKQHPAGRVGHPDDIAQMISFLIDPKNSLLLDQTSW